MCFSRVTPSLSFHPKFVFLVSHIHQMLEQSPSALLFRLCIHRSHLQQTPKQISQSSLLSLIAQFLPVSSVPFLLYGLCCYNFLLFLCPELTPKSKNWSTPISSKSHFPFHLAQSSVVVPEVCTYEGFRSSALMFMFMFILSWDWPVWIRMSFRTKFILFLTLNWLWSV